MKLQTQPGALLIRRYGPHDLESIVSKALTQKLPKLVLANADKRLLLLERDQFTLSELSIRDEIERQKRDFPDLVKIDEIWFAETVPFKGESHVHFSRFQEERTVDVLLFVGGRLHEEYRDGLPQYQNLDQS